MKRLTFVLLLIASCKGNGPAEDRIEGQDDFISAPLSTSAGQRAASAEFADGNTAAPAAAPASDAAGSATRTVEETDLYRIEGDRLYFLNGYRGLMVFDISTIDQPRLLARSPIYGTPVEMVVDGGIASVVVSDWYGKLDSGEPFHGSIVRSIDARDPANVRVLGEARLGGFIRDTRRVGDVLYAVTEDYGYSYGWGGGDVAVASPDVAVGGGGARATVTIASVNLKTVKQMGSVTLGGYAGVFNVTQHAIMLAHSVGENLAVPKTELQYVDITDPAGTIALRGKIQVNGGISGWSADNGRFNLDFSDERYARVVTCNAMYCGGTNGSYAISTVDFANPDAPVALPSLPVAALGWSVTARFSGTRLYFAPSDGYYGAATGTPIKVFDLSNPMAPALAGQTSVPGNVWMFMPNGDFLFALGSDIDGVDYGSKVSLHYLNVQNPAAPVVVDGAQFGDGWAWTPAASTFKAFTLDNAQGLVALPFSGWSAKDGGYNNGVQLIEFTATSVDTKGAAKTKGWVSRGIFSKGRLLAMSDTALSVVNYDNHAAPTVVKEITLARNVVDAVPNGNTITHLSTDWWDFDKSQSALRVLPIANADEAASLDAITELSIEGTNARLFRNGELAYVMTNLQKEIACASTGKGVSPGVPDVGGTVAEAKCYGWTQKVTVVDLSNGTAKVRGSVELPTLGYGGYYYGFFGCFPYDWYDGSDALQVGSDAIAIRRWVPSYDQDGFVEAQQALFVVDLQNADAPSLSSTTITSDPKAWWGNMFVSGNTLYATSYDWVTLPAIGGNQRGYVRYYLNSIDLSDRAAPKVGKKVNVPGVVVGVSEADPTIAFSMDYRWANDSVHNWFMTVKLTGNRAVLQGFTELTGYTGRVFPRGDKVYLSAQQYNGTATVELHELDVSNPRAIKDQVSPASKGWGWLLAVEGDRAVVTTGWGSQGVDLYKLAPGSAPAYEQTVRTRGWWSSSVSRQDDKLYLSSGYWGVQVISLQ